MYFGVICPFETLGVSMARNKRNARARNRVLTILILVLAVAICAAAPLLLDYIELECYEQVTMEAGQKLPAAADFLPESENAEKSQVSFSFDMSRIPVNVPGKYPVLLDYKGKQYSTQLVIVDTVAPKGQPQDVTVCNPETLDPNAFVTDIEDATEVTVSFAKQPDMTAQEQQVEILLTDAGGNTTRLQAQLTVINDTVAPQITGVKDLLTYVGDTLAYRTGITITDDQDENPKLEIDSSGVDLTVPGEYTVTYTATDHAGNTATASAKVTVQEKGENHVDPEVIYERIDSLMAKFIRDDMTDREKAEAVYCWTRLHFQYGKASDKKDYLQVAYEFLQTKRGDCVSSFSLQKLMFERLGIPTIDVSKVKNHPKDSNHYWLLVSIDKGQTYYHFDNVWSRQLCLVTDKALNAFSKAVNNCFNRDESLYPPTPTQDLPYSAMPWNDPAINKTLP